MFIANSEHRAPWIGILGAMLLCASLSSAQPADSSRLNSLAAGSWSLQFQIGSNFMLQPLDGMFFVKYHLTEKSAARMGVYTSGESSSFDDVVSSLERTNKSLGLGFVLQYLYYFPPRSDLSLYGGVGPTFAISWTENSFSQSLSRETVWDLGARFSLGVEWFVRHNIGLMAEHATSAVYYRNVITTASGRSTGWGFRLTRGTVRLGISLYI